MTLLSDSRSRMALARGQHIFDTRLPPRYYEKEALDDCTDEELAELAENAAEERASNAWDRQREEKGLPYF